MTVHDSTATAAKNKSHSVIYQYPALTVVPHVAEESGDYEPKAVNNEAFDAVLNRVKMLTLRRSAYAQIGHLLRLADMLDTPEAVDRPAEMLAKYASEVRQAATILEDTVQSLTDPIVKGD